MLLLKGEEGKCVKLPFWRKEEGRRRRRWL